ncbi:hypothetical protein [Enterococcus phage Nonaheksakonda]|nr:hypothetical protein [Enterococcus phage Nonaheksakonda]
MKYTMKCTKQTVEPFFTLDKEYQIAHNNTLGYFIKDDNNEIVGDGKTREELLNNLNEYWYSQFELIVIDGDKENKVLLTLDENKELSINIKKADEAEVIYMLMAGLIRVCKEVELEQDLMIETIKEIWGRVE